MGAHLTHSGMRSPLCRCTSRLFRHALSALSSHNARIEFCIHIDQGVPFKTRAVGAHLTVTGMRSPQSRCTSHPDMGMRSPLSLSSHSIPNVKAVADTIRAYARRRYYTETLSTLTFTVHMFIYRSSRRWSACRLQTWYFPVIVLTFLRPTAAVRMASELWLVRVAHIETD